MNELDELMEQLKPLIEQVIECQQRLDNFNNKEGEWDDIYDHMCQGEIEKELSYKREQKDQLKKQIKELGENNIDLLESDLLIVRQQYKELISYDKGFKNQQEVEQYYIELDRLSNTIEKLTNQITIIKNG